MVRGLHTVQLMAVQMFRSRVAFPASLVLALELLVGMGFATPLPFLRGTMTDGFNIG
jgi:hypothetical protein